MIDKIKNRPYYVLLVALAVFGIMLVTLSKDENVAEGHDENVNLFSESEYERALESRLEGLIEKIDGVGSVSVMIKHIAPMMIQVLTLSVRCIIT